MFAEAFFTQKTWKKRGVDWCFLINIDLWNETSHFRYCMFSTWSFLFVFKIELVSVLNLYGQSCPSEGCWVERQRTLKNDSFIFSFLVTHSLQNLLFTMMIIVICEWKTKILNWIVSSSVMGQVDSPSHCCFLSQAKFVWEIWLNPDHMWYWYCGNASGYTVKSNNETMILEL